ncbi:MAG: zinc-ribbon domain-containing protein [Clostridiales bacterium]|jgi:Zn finger protein HypA/HybF involved in hydrogenase expression|nr:zinc-ribbon domain-containing protein [Clostridiales bacterium]
MSDLKDTLLKFTRGVTKTSGELLKSTKLSLALSSEEDKLKQIYTEIGKKVHEIYQYGGSLGKFFDEKYSEIQRTETAIDSIKSQIDTIKGVKTCPKCGASVERNAGFCPKCGNQLDSMPPVPDAPANPEQPFILESPARLEPPSVKNTVYCRFCQTENEAGSKFCLTCGRML